MKPEHLPTLCLVEDDQIMGESLVDRFHLDGYAVDWHRDAEAAMAAIRDRRYALVISDVRLPGTSGEEMFTRLREEVPALPPFLFITGYGSIDRAVRLLKLGAADYVTKPFDLDEFVEKIRTLAVQHAAPVAAGGELGLSPAMRRLAETLPRLAQRASAVLISGESGVGKEWVARQIHHLADGAAPFVAVNCGAITESLMEAELFGHERGAFTGAVRSHRGVFEQAHGGTLFLDEIGEMPLPMQVKLLRAIQERAVVRVGGERSIPVTLRLICATNQDLKALTEQGRFREDLYYRINVIHLRVPALRERREDILWFAERFLEDFAREHGTPRRRLSADSERALLAYPWPGNLRELRHCVERACILCSAGDLAPEAFFEPAQLDALPVQSAAANLASYLQECEAAYITQALRGNCWQIGRTAAALGISRKNLWEKMTRHGIGPPQEAEPAGR
ncbi:MAG: sigma-54-dependent transcriptional regulator [Pseudomonadota bacterium]